MIDSDKKEFASILKDAFDIYDKEISNNKLMIYFQALKSYPIKSFSNAVSSHIATSKFSPKPADIIELINNQDGRPDENQAWAIAITSIDENDTVVWTQEIAEAFYIAKSILNTGDKQGAKMAFREIYSKSIAKSRELLKPVRWAVSLGHDKARVNDSINQAVIEGKLSHGDSTRYLIDSPTNDGKAIAGLLTGNVVDVNEKTKERIEAVKKVIAEKCTPFELYGDKLRRINDEKINKIDEKKKEINEFVQSKVGQRGN